MCTDNLKMATNGTMSIGRSFDAFDAMADPCRAAESEQFSVAKDSFVFNVYVQIGTMRIRCYFR
jgi:hypothetical protein